MAFARTYSDHNFHGISDLLENIFNTDFKKAAKDLKGLTTPVNISEAEDHFAIEVAAPGFEKENFTIRVEQQQLIIGATPVAQQKEGRFVRREFTARAFERSFTLPETADTEKIEAKYTNGILYVVIYKRDIAKQKSAREIAIS